jgi:hypothetical protein
MVYAIILGLLIELARLAWLPSVASQLHAHPCKALLPCLVSLLATAAIALRTPFVEPFWVAVGMALIDLGYTHGYHRQDQSKEPPDPH